MDALLFLSARRYDYVKDGRPIQGVSVSFLQPVERARDDRTTHAVLEVNGPLDLWPALKGLSALSPVDVSFYVGSRGQARLRSVAVVK